MLIIKKYIFSLCNTNEYRYIKPNFSTMKCLLDMQGIAPFYDMYHVFILHLSECDAYDLVLYMY